MVALLSRAAAQIVPPVCAFAVEPVTEETGSPFPEEQAGLEQAVASRRREFAAGRRAARAALASHGWRAVPLPRAQGGMPRWPGGMTGSISHTATAAIAVVALRENARSVGIDVEEVDAARFLHRADLLASADEVESAHAKGLIGEQALLAALFGLKEAYFKFQYPLTGRWLEFHDVKVEFRRSLECREPDERRGTGGPEAGVGIPRALQYEVTLSEPCRPAAAAGAARGRLWLGGGVVLSLVLG